MKYDINNYDYYNIVKNILNNDKFQETKYINHHGVSRYDHLARVSYYSYKVTKALKLHYEEAAFAGLLHDFFTDETDSEGKVKSLVDHPKYALDNASKYFNLTDREKDIISSHMFPITLTPPKYLESWIVDIVDNVAAIYERTYCMKKELKTVATVALILIMNLMNFR